MRRAALLTPALLLAALLAACGGGSAAIGAAVLPLPTVVAGPLASTTVYTSPDGGIYRNPLHLDVLMLARGDADALAQRLGGSAGDWSQLRGLGPFTLIALRLRNTGLAAADPETRDLQVASDFAPKQAASGPLRHFYHPTYPLAALSTVAMQECRPHLDPGQSTTLVLVYPPTTATGSLVWGRYQEFALRVAFGGGLPESVQSALHHAQICPSPTEQPQ